MRERKSRTGSALMELAMVTPLLILTAIGMVDLGRVFYASIEVNNAACAGVEYAAYDSTRSTDLTGMQTAATNDAADLSSMTATAQRRVCTDSSGTPSGCVVCATGSCSVAEPNSVFVDVRTKATVHMIFPWPGLTNKPITVNGKASMRSQ